MRNMLLSALAGLWLFLTPFLWRSEGVGGVVVAAAGAAVMVLAVMAMAFTQLGYVIAAVGAGITVGNLFVSGGVGLTANLAVTGLLLIAGGLVPTPRTVVLEPLAARAPVWQAEGAEKQATQHAA